MATEWSDVLLDQMRERGDGPADEVIATLFVGDAVDEANMLLRDLIRVDSVVPPGVPPALDAYLEATKELPEWADPDQIDRAQAFFARECGWPTDAPLPKSPIHSFSQAWRSCRWHFCRLARGSATRDGPG